MNQEQILDMQPGRDLDIAVFTKIFGQKYGPLTRQHPFAEYPHVPKYSTDISAAWEVVEYMQEKRHLVWHVWRISLIDTQASFGWHESAWGKTAPEAICKAALLAVF